MRYKDDNKIKNIFNATLDIINESGLSGVSMSKIAKRATISASTIYVYFDSKEDLLLKLYLNIKDKMNFEIYSSIDKSIPFKTVFETVLKKFIYFISNNKDYFLFIEQFQNSPIIRNISSKEANQVLGPANEFYNTGKKQGSIKNINNTLLIAYTCYPAMQLVKDHFNNKVNLGEEDINCIIRLSWDAIKA